MFLSFVEIWFVIFSLSRIYGCVCCANFFVRRNFILPISVIQVLIFCAFGVVSQFCVYFKFIVVSVSHFSFNFILFGISHIFIYIL